MNARRALAFIFCTVTLDVLALGLMVPVLPRIVLGFMDNDTARAAEVFGLFATVWGAMQFICSPLLGALSDRYGRRPVILISCLGLGLDYIFMAVAPSLTLLFVGRVISGITGASFTTAAAYIADVTPPEKRAGAFGMMESKYELSVKVAQPLIEHIKRQPYGTTVVVSGTSCRHQVQHLASVRTRHMAEVIAEALE